MARATLTISTVSSATSGTCLRKSWRISSLDSGVVLKWQFVWFNDKVRGSGAGH